MTMMNAERIRAYLKDKKIEANPVVGHPLMQEDLYTRELYFMMLCAIAGYGEVMTENKSAFIKRLIVSVEMTDKIDHYARKAAEMDEALFEEFLRVFSHSDIRYSFALDMLILLGSDGAINEKQLALVSELLEVIAVTPDEVDFLSRLARAVLEQDDQQYKACAVKPLRSIDLRRLLYYVREFAVGELVNTPHDLYVAAHGNTEFAPPVPEGMVKTYENDEVVFENILIDLSARGIAFQNNRSVRFVDCDFVGAEYPVTAENLSSLQFEHCRMRGFTQRAIVCGNCVELELTDCEFDECRCEEPYDAKGGVLLLGAVGSVSMTGCSFKSCSVSSLKGSYSCGAVLYAKQTPNEVRIAKNTFTACQCLGYNKQNKDGGLFFNIPKDQILYSEFIGVNAELTT